MMNEFEFGLGLYGHTVCGHHDEQLPEDPSHDCFRRLLHSYLFMGIVVVFVIAGDGVDFTSRWDWRRRSKTATYEVKQCEREKNTNDQGEL